MLEYPFKNVLYEMSPSFRPRKKYPWHFVHEKISWRNGPARKNVPHRNIWLFIDSIRKKVNTVHDLIRQISSEI